VVERTSPIKLIPAAKSAEIIDKGEFSGHRPGGRDSPEWRSSGAGKVCGLMLPEEDHFAMTRVTAGFIVLAVVTCSLCHAQELPAPRALPDDKKSPTKADASGTKAKMGDEKSTKRPTPILFPSPPFPPPAPPVVDPRTGAWEQINADFNVVAEVGIPPESPRPVAVASPAPTRTTLGYWLRQFKNRCTGERTIELSKPGETSEWHIAETPPGR